jgi:hypothetical protein
VAITLDKLKSLASAEGLKYFLAPDRPAILAGFGGLTGSYQVLMMVELDGRFMQFRTLGYASCPASHPHLEAVLKVLGALDYKLRLTKFGWDPSDGEIVGYADLWLEDGTLTQKQFKAMLGAFLPAIDLGHDRIQKTIDTGVDPEGAGGGSDEDTMRRIQELLRQASGGSGGKPQPDKGPDRI